MTRQVALFYVAILAIYAVMVFLSFCLPYASDDYRYMHNIRDISDIIAAQKSAYLTWSGRMVPEVVDRLLLMSHKIVPSLIVPFWYTGIVVCGMLLAFGRAWKTYATAGPLYVYRQAYRGCNFRSDGEREQDHCRAVQFAISCRARV